MNTTTTGQIIRTYREHAGMTPEELAAQLQVSTTRLSHWEEDETIPRPGIISHMVDILSIPNEDAALLTYLAKSAKQQREQEQAIKQKQITAKADQQYHKDKALRLAIMGAIGFLIGLVFFYIIDFYQDPWYMPLFYGACTAGIPFGWSILTDKEDYSYGSDYHPDPEIYRTNLLITLGCWVIKFIAAVLIGVLFYPAALLYHGYKAGRKGTAYRTILFGLFLIVAIVSAILIAGVVISCFI